MEQSVRSHPWELAGLGRAPFRLFAITENRFALPGGGSKPGGACDYCGTGILYEFHYKSSDGRKFKVGCDCIARCHDPAEKIVVEAKKAERQRRNAAVRERKAESARARKEAREAQWVAEAAANKARVQTDPLYLRLQAQAAGNGFLAQMVTALERWGALTSAQEAAAVKVLERVEGEPARKAASFHLGAVGERVVIAGTVEFSRCIFASTNRVYEPDRWLNKIRTDAGAVVAWFGAYGLEAGSRIEGTARVSKLDVYQDEAQTVIKNPRWK